MRHPCLFKPRLDGLQRRAAVGAGVTTGHRPVLALTGDAAFAMGAMEIHTAAELATPVIWLVLNNGGNAMVRNVQEGTLGRSIGAMYERFIDAATVARGLGAHATVVSTLAEFAEALPLALASRGPYLIDTRVDPHEVPWALSARINILQASFDHGEEAL